MSEEEAGIDSTLVVPEVSRGETAENGKVGPSPADLRVGQYLLDYRNLPTDGSRQAALSELDNGLREDLPELTGRQTGEVERLMNLLPDLRTEYARNLEEAAKPRIDPDVKARLEQHASLMEAGYLNFELRRIIIITEGVAKKVLQGNRQAIAKVMDKYREQQGAKGTGRSRRFAP